MHPKAIALNKPRKYLIHSKNDFVISFRTHIDWGTFEFKLIISLMNEEICAHMCCVALIKLDVVTSMICLMRIYLNLKTVFHHNFFSLCNLNKMLLKTDDTITNKYK